MSEMMIGGPIVCPQCQQAYNCATDIHVCKQERAMEMPIPDKMMTAQYALIDYNEAWQTATDLEDAAEPAFKAGWDAALAKAEQQIQAQKEEIGNLNSHLENGEEMYIAMRGRCAAIEVDLDRCQEEYEKQEKLVSTLQATVTRLSAPVSDEEIMQLWLRRAEWETGGKLCDYGAYKPVIEMFIASRTDQESKPSKEGQ